LRFNGLRNGIVGQAMTMFAEATGNVDEGADFPGVLPFRNVFDGCGDGHLHLVNERRPVSNIWR
jgi:hypothetical protein